MALILKDRVQETSTTTGTGTLTLAGAVTQFQTFSSAVGNGNTTYYTIYNAGGTQWEVGLGTVGAGTLSRDTVLASSNANALVSFTGTLYVFGDYPAGKAVYLDAIGTATVSQLATSSTTNTTPVLSYNASNSNYAAGATVSGSYLQTVMQNKSGTAGASTNFAVSNDLGTDSSYYGEFGMNSSVYSSGTPADFFSLNNGIYYSGHDGPITVGSGNGQNLYLAWGTTGQSSHVINTTGAIGLNTNITGTSNFGSSGQVLTSAGSAATPTWTTPTTGTVTSITSTTLTVGGTTSIPTVNLTSGIATAGTTGSATLIPVITIDTYGRVTSITTAANPQGTVTSVTGTAPVVSSGGATPAISMAAATGSVNGYLTSTDWTTFNNKGSGSVTSVAATVPSFLSVSGSPVTSSGTLALTYSGTALPAANGGTGLTSPGTSGNVLTSNGSAWVSSTPSGTITWQSAQTSNFTAAVGNAYPVNTTSAAITVSLPASATSGQQFSLIDYAGTWATNNVKIDLNGAKLNGVTGSGYIVFLRTNRQSVNFVYVDSTQGWLANVNNSNSFVPAPPIVSSVDYLVVAGGGGALVGGGGAGGFRTGTLAVATSFTVTVGAGGTGGVSSNGSDSVFSSVTSTGGGGVTFNGNGNAGGSGGGADASGGAVSGGAGTSGQGNNGGSSPGGSPYPGGGGGGASAVGGDSPGGSTGGNGGNGSSSSISGSSVTYAGGGGGSVYSGGTGGTGGTGGGGAGNGSGAGTAGTANTGGGGGGGLSRTGGNGGSGVVIIAYSSAYPDFTSIGGGLTYTKTTSGGNTIYKFTAGTGTVTI